MLYALKKMDKDLDGVVDWNEFVCTVALIMAECYGIAVVHWRFMNLMNLPCKLLMQLANLCFDTNYVIICILFNE